MVVSSQLTRIKSIPLFSHSFSSYSLYFQYPNSIPLLRRTIFSTAQLENLWFEKLKGVFTGKKSEPEVQPASQAINLDDKPSVSTESTIEPESNATPETPTFEKMKGNKTQPEPNPTPQASIREKLKGPFKSTAAPPIPEFLFSNFAETLKFARKTENLGSYLPGQKINATQAAELEKQEEIYRYFAGFNDTGENLQSIQKLDAARHCNCTLTEVECAILKFSVCKKAEVKLRKMREEGKPMPTTMDEFKNTIGDPAALLKEHHIGRNDPCPCGSRMIYKWCCGKIKE